MASSKIAKPNNRQIKYFDVPVAGGVSQYNFSSLAPSDYEGAKRLCAMSTASGTAIVSQLGSTTLYFSQTLPASTVIRIVYYVD